MPKAFSYLRFSTPEQAKGDSDRRQTELARNYAAKHDLDLDESSYRDLGVSSFRGTNARTGALGQFLAAIDSGAVPIGSLLLVENLDRVSRQDPWDALPVFQQIINAGVAIVTLQDGKTWSREEMRANPMRLFESLFTMVRAHEESETKSRRLKASWAGRRAKAAEKPITSRGPAWLHLDEQRRWHVLEERAEVVRRIYVLAASGAGENAIAATLNRDGVPTFGDNGRAPATMWRKSYVTKVLESRAVVGTLVPHTMKHEGGKKVRETAAPVDGYYPAIVTRELWATVRTLKDTRNPLRGRHAAKPLQNIFGGLARCSCCGEAMTRVYKGSARRQGKPKLVCVGSKTGKGCPYAPVSLDIVERAVIDNLELLSLKFIDSEWSEGVDEVKQQQRTRIDEIDEIMSNMVKGDRLVRDSTAWKLLSELSREKEDLEEHYENVRRFAEIMAEPAVAKQLEKLRLAFTTSPMDRTGVNVALRTLFERVEVNVAGGLMRFVPKVEPHQVADVRFTVPSIRERMSANAKRQRRTADGRYLRLVS